MTVFWIVASLLIAMAILIVLSVIVLKVRSEQTEQAMNVSLYQQKKDDIEKDIRSGLLCADNQEDIEQELQLELLAFDKEDKQRKTSSPVYILFFAALSIPLISIAIYQKIGTDPRKITVQKQYENNESVTLDDIETMAIQLEEKLLTATEPKANEWLMLAKTYLMLKNYDKAIASFKVADNKSPNNASLLSAYAEALFYKNKKQFNPEIAHLFQRAYQLDNDNDKANWMLGMLAFEQKNNAVAGQHWQKLALKYPNNDNVKAHLAKIATKKQVENINKTVQVFVSINAEVLAQVNAEDVVFILAKAENGPPMPLAVVKKQVKAFPAKIQLDDSLAMMPKLKISAYDRLIIIARISRSGLAKAQPGDFEARIKIDGTNTEMIRIDINEQIE